MNALPPDQDIPVEGFKFAGEFVQVRRLTGFDTLRLVKILHLLKEKMGLTDDDIAGLDLSLNTVKTLVTKVWSLLQDSIDLDSHTLSPEVKLVFGEIGRYIGKTAEEVAAAELDDISGVVARILEQERDGWLGKQVQAISEQIQNRAKMLMAVAMELIKDRLSVGGIPDGGMTLSSIPSEKPTDGPTTISSDSPSPESSST